MFDFRINPPMLFAAPRPHGAMTIPRRFAFAELSVELFVPHLETFAVPDADLPRLAEAVQAALQPVPTAAMGPC